MSDQTEIVIASGARTPIGAFNGSFSAIPAHTLGAAAITAALSRADVNAGDVSEVILGQVLTAGAGMNPARQAAMAAGVPESEQLLVLTKSAARAFGPWPSALKLLKVEMLLSSSRAARKA